MSLAGASARELIPGDPEALTALGRQFNAIASGLADAASVLDRIKAGSWRGEAADAFRRAVDQQPRKYSSAADAFSHAGNALLVYAQELLAAQQQAASAVAEYESADAQSRTWRAATSTPGANANQPSSDPGNAGRGAAEGALNSARGQLDAAAARVRAALESAAQAAPREPSLLEKMWGGAVTVSKGVFEFGAKLAGVVVGLETGDLTTWWHFAQGVGEGLYGIAKGVWDLGGGIAFVLAHPDEAWARATQIASAVAEDPVGFGERFGKAILNWDEWANDPAKAFGELVPTIAIAVLSAGASAYAEGAGEAAGGLAEVSNAAAVSGEYEIAADTAEAASVLAARADLAHKAVTTYKVIDTVENVDSVIQVADAAAADSTESDGKGVLVDWGVGQAAETAAGQYFQSVPRVFVVEIR